MSSITLFDRTTRATASILPLAGFNCHSLKIPCGRSTIEVLDSEPDFGQPGSPPSRSGIPLLFPFPNRIREGKFIWQGREYALTRTRRDPHGNAIHGLVIDKPWRVLKHESDTLIGAFHLAFDQPELRDQWPADFLIEVQYLLAGGVLRCDIRIVNTDHVLLPWGFGTHPYFRVPLAKGGCAGDILIQAPAAEFWELVESLPTGRCLPVPADLDLREGQTLAGLKLDHLYTGLTSRRGVIETIVMDPSAGVQVTQSFGTEFGELVVFTPPHGRSVCLEPYTCATDAANLAARKIDSGWRVLGPGAEQRLWFEITANAVVA